MTDKPIIFSAAMVQALLDGRKTQTRRLLKPQPELSRVIPLDQAGWFGDEEGEVKFKTPIATGDRLYVRETCRATELKDGNDGIEYMADNVWREIANTQEAADRWGQVYHYGKTGPKGRIGQTVPAIHMPRWASRLTLTVTDVRVQRLQEISTDDAIAEGRSSGGEFLSGRRWFRDLWNSLHGPDAWDANPWVAAYTFTVQRGNIDEVAK